MSVKKHGLDEENCRYKIIACDAATLDIWREKMLDGIPEIEMVNPYWFVFPIKYSEAIERAINVDVGPYGRIMVYRLPDNIWVAKVEPN